MAEKQRKMTKIKVLETSGVDHPAHQHEGWMVCKSADRTTVDELFGNTNADKEGANVADKETPTVEELQAKLDAALAEKTTLEAKVVELSAAPEQAAEELDEAGKLAEMAKSKELPEAVRTALAKQAEEMTKAQERMEKAEEDLRKERDARLDEHAIAKSKSDFSHIAVDHDTMAPALRRIAVINEDLAKSVETALKAADEQLKTAGLFSEVGKSAENAGAVAKLHAIAEQFVADGVASNRPDGIAKAAAANPALYVQYKNEIAGN